MIHAVFVLFLFFVYHVRLLSPCFLVFWPRARDSIHLCLVYGRRRRVKADVLPCIPAFVSTRPRGQERDRGERLHVCQRLQQDPASEQHRDAR